MAGGTASNLPSPRMRRSASCERRAAEEKGGVSNGWILILMAALFLGLGYIGVPVAFSLTAGVLLATVLTPISQPALDHRPAVQRRRFRGAARGAVLPVGGGS